MKLIKTLSCVVILSLTFASYAEAKGRSFGGGFRSQRTAPAPRPVPQQNAQPLNMSKDLNANAAQGNALKTAPTAATTGQAAAGSGNSGWFRSGNTAKQSPQQGPAAMQSGAQSGMRQGGGFMNNIMWFMLGSSLASHGRAAPAPAEQAPAEQAPAEQAPAGQVAAGQTPAEQSAAGQAVQGPVTQAQDSATQQSVSGEESMIAAPVEAKESFFMGLLRIVLWGAIFYGIYKVVKMVMRSRATRAAKKPDYTFGNN